MKSEQHKHGNCRELSSVEEMEMLERRWQSQFPDIKFSLAKKDVFDSITTFVDVLQRTVHLIKSYIKDKGKHFADALFDIIFECYDLHYTTVSTSFVIFEKAYENVCY